MYPHFIEVHQNGIPMLMNIDHIICTSDKCDKQKWKSVAMVTGCSIDEAWGLDETYDELKQLITNSGCLINKGDPRLDNKPLTGFDFMGMKEGEPIWSPNLQEWYLFSSYDPDHMEGKVKDAHGNTGIFDRDTLIKFPLYRMKGIRLADYEFDHPEIDERLIQTTKKEEK